MKKIAILGFSILIFCAIFCIPQLSSIEVSANVYETDNQIRVFIGSTENMNSRQAKEYNEAQQTLLKQLSNNYADEVGPALVTFKRFLSEKEANALLSGTSSIDTVYIWTPNKQGRAIIDVENNDINAAIKNFFVSTDIENLSESEYKRDMQELFNNYGIFAVEVKATYSVLENMSCHADINIDLIQSPSAVALADETNKPLSYICIPEKPDGTA